MKNVVLLGASGSIGTQAIDVIKQHPELFNLIGISVNQNVDYVNELLTTFDSIKYVNLGDNCDASCLDNFDITITYGQPGLEQLASTDEADYILNAVIGFAGLAPSVSAIKAKKTLGLANKETLVCAGDIIMPLVEQYQAQLIPIDSEHSAIFQALQGESYEDIKRLILTASGGSFRDLSKEELANVTVEQALSHPTWNMGAGITIDSATMFNKALEIIEAHHLFNVDYDRIDVLIHPQSIDHSMVEFIDGSCIGQLSFPDMRIPIAYALSYPRRISIDIKRDIMEMANLTFEKPDLKRFSALKIAYAVGKQGHTYPTVLNAAKEEANNLFINNKIKFIEIETIIKEALIAHQVIVDPCLEDLYQVDQQTREWVKLTYNRL
mgnify:FL=1